MASPDLQPGRSRDEGWQTTRRREIRVCSGGDPEIVVRLEPPGSPCSFAAVVSLRGEHDLATNAELRETVGSVFGDVLVDLTECSFIDCTTIGVLVGTHRKLVRDGHRLELIAPAAQTQVARLLELVRLSEIIPVSRHEHAGAREA